MRVSPTGPEDEITKGEVMGRTSGGQWTRERVAESLVKSGVPRGFAVDVADTYVRDGASQALVVLHAGGWELHVGREHPREKVLYLRRVL